VWPRPPANSTPGPDVTHRVDGFAVAQDLEVNVGAGRAAAAAHLGDGLALLDQVADRDQVFLIVSVAGDVAVAVVELDQPAVAALLARPGDDPGGDRDDVTARAAGKIDAFVTVAFAGEGIGATPVTRGDPALLDRASARLDARRQAASD
jgi:hypothetical protein